MSDNDFAGSAPLATPAQVKFFRSLLEENTNLMHGTKWYQDLDSAKQDLFDSFMQETIEGAHEIPKSDISRKIDQYKTANAKLRQEARESAPAPAALPFGVYLVGEKVIRVYPGRGSGRMLAAEITADGPVYLGLASRFVKADQRVSHDEAARYGAQFGICCVCGLVLTDPISVQAGIGPICSGRYNG